MAENHESTMKWKLDIKEFKANIQEAKRQMALATAEFKKNTAGAKNWASSITGVQAKVKQLGTVLKSQKTILSELEKEYATVADNMGEASPEAQRLQVQIERQKAAIASTERQISQYNSQLNDLESEQKEADSALGQLNDTISEQEQELAELKRQYANSIVGDNPEEAERLAQEIEGLSQELQDNKTKLENAESAADQFDVTLKEVENSAEGAQSGFTVFKGALADLLSNGIQKVIGGMQDMVTQTIEVGKAFDSSMANVNALQTAAGATDEDLAMLRETAKQLGETTQFSASQAADALSYMALAGWDAKTSADALPGVLNLAAASGMDLAKASDLVTDYLSAFNMSADQSAYFADMLAYAQANSNTTTEQLGEAFKNSAATMNAAGQDIETTTSLLSMLANQGLKGSEAGTALSAMMRDLTAKMQDGKIMIGDTAIEVMDANGNYRDMTDILRDVEAATDGMGDAEKAMALQSTFTSDSIKGLNLILNAGVDNAAEFEDGLRNSGGTAEKMAEIMNDNLGGDLTALNSKLEGVQISLYEKFEPALRSGVDVLSELLDAVNFVVDHSTEFTAAITAMAAGMAAYVAYTTALNIMTNGWKSLTIVTKAQAAAQAVLNAAMSANPIGLIIAAIVALVAAFVVLWKRSETFRNFWIGLWNGIKTAVEPVITFIKQMFTAAWDNIKAAWSAASTFFSGVWNGIKNIFSAVVSVLSGYFSAAWNGIKLIWDVVSSYFKAIWDSIANIFSVVQAVLQGDFQGAWDAIKAIVNTWIGFFQKVWNGIKNVFSSVRSWFSSTFKGAFTAVKNAFSGWAAFFGNLWTQIKNKFTNIGSQIGSAVGGAARTAINGVIGVAEGAINSGIDLINGAINLINKLPGVSVGKVGRVSFPRMARGGVLKRGQVGLLEGDGAEAVVPLEKNKQWIARVASDMIEQLGMENLKNDVGANIAGIKAGAGNTINENCNNTQNVIFNQTINSPKAVDRLTLYRETNGLLFGAKVRLSNV